MGVYVCVCVCVGGGGGGEGGRDVFVHVFQTGPIDSPTLSSVH